MTNISDLIALKQAFASGYVTLLPANSTYPTYCPPDFDCESCAFYRQCDSNDSIDRQYIHLSLLPEWQLTLEELALQYPEYFI